MGRLGPTGWVGWSNGRARRIAGFGICSALSERRLICVGSGFWSRFSVVSGPGSPNAFLLVVRFGPLAVCRCPGLQARIAEKTTTNGIWHVMCHQQQLTNNRY